MTRREKNESRAAKMERTRLAFMECVQARLGGMGECFQLAEWKIKFGPPHCFSRGPYRQHHRKAGPAMTHVVKLPKSWLEDVYEQGLARIRGGAMILAAAKARCDCEGYEAWAVIVLMPDGRRVRAVRDLYVVRFGGYSAMASSIELAVRGIEDEIRVELGLAEVPFSLLGATHESKT
jgi:hypothetical protein